MKDRKLPGLAARCLLGIVVIAMAFFAGTRLPEHGIVGKQCGTAAPVCETAMPPAPQTGGKPESTRKSWYTGDPDMRVFSQADGSRVVWLRHADARNFHKYNFLGNPHNASWH